MQCNNGSRKRPFGEVIIEGAGEKKPSPRATITITTPVAVHDANSYSSSMSTAQEIENAIRSLSPSEREKLLQHIPTIFPEFAGDSEWARITHDERPRPELSKMLNRYEAEISEDPQKFPKVAEGDFDPTV